MQKYGITIEQLSVDGAAAARAAERSGAFTIIYREQLPIAAVISFDEMKRIDSSLDHDGGEDPLLSLCGSCTHDGFVDTIIGDFGSTMLFQTGRRRLRPRLPRKPPPKP
jgi:hypothetical protein